ncbi:Crp/Fnr family transcriptional regulator [candidate division KSB1 bacterium]
MVHEKNCRDCKFRSPLFNFLSEKEFDLINQNRFEVKFKAGETIRKQGTYLSHVISLNKGLAKLYLEGIDNRNVILRIISPTNFIGGPGLYVDQRHHYTVTALIESVACFIEREVFKEIIHSNRNFAEEFIKDLSNNTLTTYNRLINLTQKQIPGRMADALVYLSDEIFKSKSFKILLSKQDLADLSGMSKDSAVRGLRSFKEEGIIDMNKDLITLLDYEALKKISRIG